MQFARELHPSIFASFFSVAPLPLPPVVLYICILYLFQIVVFTPRHHSLFLHLSVQVIRGKGHLPIKMYCCCVRALVQILTLFELKPYQTISTKAVTFIQKENQGWN